MARLEDEGSAWQDENMTGSAWHDEKMRKESRN
jgi:hypothetical protein